MTNFSNKSVRNNTDAAERPMFHDLMVELGKLGERRNDIVHSKYNTWLNVEGQEGLLRTNSKLRGSKGAREQKVEELQPETFNADLKRLSAAAIKLERFRLQVIDWLYPDNEVYVQVQVSEWPNRPELTGKQARVEATYVQLGDANKKS